MRVVKFWREYISDQSIESIGNKELSGYVRSADGYADVPVTGPS